MNKVQCINSLEKLCFNCLQYSNWTCPCEHYKRLEQLINEHFFRKNCNECCGCDILPQEDCPNYMAIRINELEKALDKACSKLEEYDCLYGDLKQANEWKEWCLKND